METGTVKWFDAIKGFGFVVPSSGGAEVYVHAKVLEKAKLQTLETAPQRWMPRKSLSGNGA